MCTYVCCEFVYRLSELMFETGVFFRSLFPLMLLSPCVYMSFLCLLEEGSMLPFCAVHVQSPCGAKFNQEVNYNLRSVLSVLMRTGDVY